MESSCLLSNALSFVDEAGRADSLNRFQPFLRPEEVLMQPEWLKDESFVSWVGLVRFKLTSLLQFS